MVSLLELAHIISWVKKPRFLPWVLFCTRRPTANDCRPSSMSYPSIAHRARNVSSVSRRFPLCLHPHIPPHALYSIHHPHKGRGVHRGAIPACCLTPSVSCRVFHGQCFTLYSLRPSGMASAIVTRQEESAACPLVSSNPAHHLSHQPRPVKKCARYAGVWG